jgi:hypothetical protein
MMLQVLSQTNLDLTMFIGNDEPTFKIAGLNLGLFKKGYHCEGTGAIATTFMSDPYGKHIEGLRTRFTKTENARYHHSRYSQSRSHFKRKVNVENTLIDLTVSRGIKRNGKVEVSVRIVPSDEDRKKLLENDIVSKYSRHIKTSEEMVIIPVFNSSVDVNSNDFFPKTEEEESANLHLDTIVARVKDFEESHKHLYPFLVMRNFTGLSNSTHQEISLAEFDKFTRQISIIEDVSIPTKCARKKFIEICDIFKNNNVLTKLKANNFEFCKTSKGLAIEFFGIQLVNEEEFKHFQYFDHPGINFCADYLDKSKTFDIVEAKISKEIITRI